MLAAALLIVSTAGAYASEGSGDASPESVQREAQASQEPEGEEKAEAAAEASEDGAGVYGDDEEATQGEPLPALVWYDGTVTRVRDTDVIEIDGEKMRLLGVTGPRRWWWGAPRDCHAQESVGFLEEMIDDRTVQYAFDPAVGPDRRHGFRRVYVMEGDRLINAELIEKGHALVDRSRHYAMRGRFEEFEAAAKLHMLGLWHTCPVECYRNGKVCRVKNW